MESIGIDLVEVKRINRLIKNKKFATRVFTDKEITYCNSKKNSAQHYAVRFAAKEAVWKALSATSCKGGSQNLNHKNISINNTVLGRPQIVLPHRLKDLEKRISVSLTHTKSYAVAVVIVGDATRQLRHYPPKAGQPRADAV